MMELRELTAYALEQYHIGEEYKWADFPQFSVLTDPATGKWAALLMRQWDGETGTTIEFCDIKCGQEVLRHDRAPFLSPPFRMRGKKWVGVRFSEETDADTVCRLFDQALKKKPAGYTVVLKDVARGVSYVPAKKGDPGAFRNDDAGEDGSWGELSASEGDAGAGAEGTLGDVGSGAIVKGPFGDVGASGAAAERFQETQIRAVEKIRARTPEETLAEMEAEWERLKGSRLANDFLRERQRQKLLEYALLKELPVGVAQKYLAPKEAERDRLLAMLREPKAYGDEAVVAALSALAGGKTMQSPVLTKTAGEGARLFAGVWEKGGEPLFTQCFGELVRRRCRPVLSPLYYEAEEARERFCQLNPCRSYSYEDECWWVTGYQELYFDRRKLRQLLHETDRMLRLYLKVGGRLKEMADEAWATPLVAAVIEEDRRAKAEAARPKVVIDLTGLDRIRQEAAETRESLLTEEERGETEEVCAARLRRETEEVSAERFAECLRGKTENAFEKVLERNKKGLEEEASEKMVIGLPAPYYPILRAVLESRSVKAEIAAIHGMPEIIADAINEAFYDEIGDNIVTCDGEEIVLVEDYREEVEEWIQKTEEFRSA